MTNIDSNNPGSFEDRYSFVPTHPNLNDSMTPEQKKAFRAFMQTGDGLEEVIDDGRTLTFVVPDRPISVQSVQESVLFEQQQRTSLGD